MQGVIVQVSTSLGGLPKRAVSGGLITPLGIEGDFHAHTAIHGGPLKAILMVASEVIDGLIARGYPLFHGALGENFTTRGITFRDIRIGDRLRAGGAMIEITAPRDPCSGLDIYGESLKEKIRALDRTSPRWGMSGFYASVVEPGRVRPDDIIAVVAKLA
jgi:MOSC domain-containing protein YiiM